MAIEQQRNPEKQNYKMVPSKGRLRKKPGNTGKGDYYHVEVRPQDQFIAFWTQDVGRRGHIQRVAGQRSSGYWATVKWLIGKEDAHVQGEKLIPDTKAAKDVIKQLGSPPVHLLGDRFRARPRPNVPEHDKPTPAQQRARRENIKKARTAQSR